MTSNAKYKKGDCVYFCPIFKLDIRFGKIRMSGFNHELNVWSYNIKEVKNYFAGQYTSRENLMSKDIDELRDKLNRYFLAGYATKMERVDLLVRIEKEKNGVKNDSKV